MLPPLCSFCPLLVSSSDFSVELVLLLLFEKLAGKLAGKEGKEGEDEEEAAAEATETELTLKPGAGLVVVKT